MGIEGIEKLAPDEAKIPESAQICKCGHSLERHRPYNSSKNQVCIERFCACSNFVLNNIK
jgi:hypothetical protein